MPTAETTLIPASGINQRAAKRSLTSDARLDNKPNSIDRSAVVAGRVNRREPRWFFRGPACAKLYHMKATGILLFIATVAGVTVSAGAAELRVMHRHAFRHTLWRVGPQACFLMPDVIVAVDALGPYCSSPRGRYHWIMRRS
jgi:hypothetical protein